MSKISNAAEFLVNNRRLDQVADTLPPDLQPANWEEAYATQQVLVDHQLSDHGGKLVGYKIAATNPVAQEMLGVEGPLFGRLLSAFVHAAPAEFAANDFQTRVLEPEYAFLMKDDVPAGQQDFTAESIASYVAGVLPSIEIVNHHFTNLKQAGGMVLVCDNAVHGAWLHGKNQESWTDLDMTNTEIRLLANGQIDSTGNGTNVLEHPLNALAWLANELPKFGLQLSAGDYVTTGLTTKVYAATPGDQVTADFGPLGSVELKFN